MMTPVLLARRIPNGNLWDNGADAIAELENLLKVRAYALGRFSENNIRPGRPLATLEEVLVPLYLLHRFQVQAVGKIIGGQNFTYALRGDGQVPITGVDGKRQREAIDALFNTLSPAVLLLPENVLQLIPARPPGHPKSRETFPRRYGQNIRINRRSRKCYRTDTRCVARTDTRCTNDCVKRA